MDFGFYKRASRGIKHRAAATPFFYPRKPPAHVAPAALPVQQATAGGKAKQPTAATMLTTMPAPPPSPVAAVEAVAASNGGGVVGGGDAADVDLRAAMYISRVQERLRRERTVDDWRMYY